MAINKKNAKAKEKEVVKYDYEIQIKRAFELPDGTIMFDMYANHVLIKGCAYKTFERKDGSGEFNKIDFPSRKGKDGKYYNEVYFFIDEKVMADIEHGIEAILNKEETEEA